MQHIILVMFGACVNIWFITKFKIIVLIKWSYRSPKRVDYWTLSG